MEVITFDRKEYVKASVLAARFRYTADYLGQLCRGKKVDARLVGRAWYINVDSLNTHKDTRYKPLPKAEGKTTLQVHTTAASPHYTTRIDVEPILKKKTVSIYQAKPEGLTEVRVKYESDEHALIPRVNKEAISHELKVGPAEAETVRVRKEGGSTFNFKAEELPEVYLHGSLRVMGLEEATETAEPRQEMTEESDADIEAESEVTTEISSEIKPERIEPAVSPSVKVRTKRLRPTARTAVAVVPSITASVEPHDAVTVTILPEKPLPIKAAIAPTAPKVTPMPALIRPRLIRGTAQAQRPARIVDIHLKTVPLTAEKPLPAASVSLSEDPKKHQTQTVRAAAVVTSSFKPQAVKEKESTNTEKVRASSGWLLPVAICCFAFLIAGSLLIVEVDLEVSKEKIVKHIFFTTDQLEAAVALIY